MSLRPTHIMLIFFIVDTIAQRGTHQWWSQNDRHFVGYIRSQGIFTPGQLQTLQDHIQFATSEQLGEIFALMTSTQDTLTAQIDLLTPQFQEWADQISAEECERTRIKEERARQIFSTSFGGSSSAATHPILGFPPQTLRHYPPPNPCQPVPPIYTPRQPNVPTDRGERI